MILVTGAAGFIGMHTSLALLRKNYAVIGLDNLNAYYDPALKQARLAAIRAAHPDFIFIQHDLAQPESLAHALGAYAGKVTHVVHLAAQAGVRYSLEAPRSYISANINGMMEILEFCRHQHGLQKLVYASSSSVYGNSSEQPFQPSQRTDHPVSLYAATKKSGEILAESYAHLYNLPITGLRFFTVYGPWGRPDMAYFSFSKAITEGKSIALYNGGDMRRDFTYIDDIVGGVLGATFDRPGQAGHRLYNLGNHRAEKLTDLVAYLEAYLGRKASIALLPMQPGDVVETYADIGDAARDFGYQPRTTLEQGLKPFVEWFLDYYRKTA